MFTPLYFRSRKILPAIILFLFTGYCVLNSAGFHPGSGESFEEKETGVDKQMSMWWQARAFPDPYYLESKYQKAWQYAQQMRGIVDAATTTVDRTATNNVTIVAATSAFNGSWTSIGPNTGIGGRILSIAIDPTNGNNLFAGSASGGIWKSVNGGSSWQHVVTNYPVLGVPSIIINPVNPKIIFAGTGEVYRMDSTGVNPDPGNTGFNVWKTRGTYGVGILKSADGGSTWSLAYSKTEANLFGIQRMRFDPSNPSVIYAAATDGLYKSADSGATWNRILTKTYVSDVVINKANANQLIVAVGNLKNTDKGIYQSLNGGSSWSKINSGLPATFRGFIKFDYVPSSPSLIVASIGVDESGSPKEIYVSTNFGTTWTAKASSTHSSYQFWCAHAVAINPSNTNQYIFGGVSLYAYNVSSSTSARAGSSVHSDIHDIRFDPTNSNIVYVTCDGGIYKSTNAGSTFTAINNGLGATQFYSTVGVSSTDANFVVGGLQDNGVIKFNGTSWSSFPGLSGTDGASCFVDPTNDNYVLASGDARAVYLSANKGSSSSSKLAYWGAVADSRTGFVAPMAISKSNSSYMYVATDNLHVSTNRGSSFTGGSYSTATNYIEKKNKTGIAISVSPKNNKKIYVSTSPFAQFDNDADNLYYNPPSNILKSLTGNTPFTSIKGTAPNNLPDRYVMRFAISPTNDDSVWVALGGFGTAHIYVTPDGGANWYSKDAGPLSGGLPDVPANAVMLDPNNSNIIYVGNDLGVYVSTDAGTTWQDYNAGFWDATLVMDLEPLPGGKMLAATHGKGAFVSPLYSVSVTTTAASAILTGKSMADYNQLNWELNNESGVNSFDLERGADLNALSRIATVRPNALKTYLYRDYQLNTTANRLYYRLKLSLAGGQSAYSNVVTLDKSAVAGARVINSYFSDQVKISVMADREQQVIVRLLDISGKTITLKQYSVAGGQQEIRLENLSSLPAGMYFVETRIGGKPYVQKLMKQ